MTKGNRTFQNKLRQVLAIQLLVLLVLTDTVHDLLLLDSLLNNQDYVFHPSVAYFTL